MKKIYLLITILFVSIGFAQIPAGYYNTATGTGYTLKTQLKSIITAGHIDRGYGSGSSQTNNGLWSAYGTTDRDNGIGYENDNTIVDIYSENPTGTDPYNYTFSSGQCGNVGNEGTCYNREHLIPQSYFGGNTPPSQFAIMRNDIHHIYPTDGKVNGTRSDFAFGKVNVASSTSLNGSKLGSALNSGYSAGFSGTVFEPIDEFKGDIARAFLYFATRYEDSMDDLYTTYTSVDCRVMFDGSTNKVFSTAFLNILLKWNELDPVSTKEIVRNNAGYVHQGNRNPYVDHPEYVCQVWTTACAALAAEDFTLADSFNIYPNPSNGNFNIDFKNPSEEYSIEVYSLIGQKVFEKQNTNSSSIAVTNLQSGMYLVKVTKDSRSIIKKIVIN